MRQVGVERRHLLAHRAAPGPAGCRAGAHRDAHDAAGSPGRAAGRSPRAARRPVSSSPSMLQVGHDADDGAPGLASVVARPRGGCAGRAGPRRGQTFAREALVDDDDRQARRACRWRPKSRPARRRAPKVAEEAGRDRRPVGPGQVLLGRVGAALEGVGADARSRCAGRLVDAATATPRPAWPARRGSSSSKKAARSACSG